MNTTARPLAARAAPPAAGKPTALNGAIDPAQLIPLAKPSRSVQFYQDEAFFVSELSRFIGTALMEDGAVIVIATKAHRDALSRRLQNLGLNIGKVIERGCYVTLDAAETLAKFMRAGWPDQNLFNKTLSAVFEQASLNHTAQDRHLTVFGEMVALLWAQGQRDAAIRLEQMWNELAETYSFSLRCAYPIARVDRESHGERFLKVCNEHSHVIPAESYLKLSEEEDRRSITELQQKASALEREIAGRKQIEEALRRTKAQLEDTVEERTSCLRQLSVRLLTLQDVERRRIARELHDGFGQYLVGLKLNVDMLRQSPNREDLWSEVEALMQRCIREVRTLSYLLHPPTMDEAGFVSAARWYAEGFGQRSRVQVTIDAPQELERMPDEVELTLFRVLQEALTNVHRHSGSSRAYVSISRDAENVLLEIRDNGRGMSQELLRHFMATGTGMGTGLAGVRERAREFGGKLTMDADHNGTLLAVSIPVVTSQRKKKPQTT